MICFLISFNEMCFQASSIQFNYFFMLKNRQIMVVNLTI